jgi:hypothetical protein
MLVRIFLIAVLTNLIPLSVQSADSSYVNYGVATNELVDATTFLNYGNFYVGNSVVPWNSLNTKSYTNRGLMAGTLGFTFQTITSPYGIRSAADSFVNASTGIIESQEAGGFLGFLGSVFIFTPDAAYLTVSAEHIENHGQILTGPSGNIHIAGQTVDLSGGSLIVNPINTSTQFSGIFFGSFFLDETNFVPDSGIYDLSWGVGVNTNTRPDNILFGIDPTLIVSPPFRSTNEVFFCQNQLVLDNASTWVRSTFVNETNFNIQVVAVQTADTNIAADVRFADVVYPNGFPQGGFLTPMVEFRSNETNIITLDTFTNTLYVIDQIASGTNYNLLQNLLSGTFRPAPLILTRSTPFEFETAFPSNDVITPDIFDNPAYSNRIVTNIYAAYAAQVENTTRRLPALPDVGYTNASGRVDIRAADLNLSGARIRGEGLVSIDATNIIDSSDAIIDVAHEDIRVATTSASPLKIDNLARPSVQRFGGNLSMFTTLWTNVFANPDTNFGPIEVHFTLLMVDATQMKTVQPVITHQLVLTAPGPSGQVQVNDPLQVTDRIAVDAPSLTLNSQLILGNGLVWSPTNFVRLENLTNNGFLQLTDLADMESGSENNPVPLKSFVNNGTVMAFSHLINTEYFENNGSIVSTQYFRSALTDICLGTVIEFTNSLPSIGPISINATTAKFENGTLFTSGDVLLSGGTLKMNKSGTTAGGAVYFNVTNILTDSGASAGNLIEVHDGIKMAALRPSGDLLGTDIRTFAGKSAIAEHTWSSEDRGATASGFDNNLAIGTLEIEGADSSKYRFSGSLPNSAIYVDELYIGGQQSTNLSALTNRVTLNGLNLYYGDIQSSNPSFTAESLNGLQLGTGRLLWVTNYAGAVSGVDVALSPTGPTVRMNRALRLSPNLDSDNDGIPNLYDEFPLTPATGLRITSVQVSSGSSLGFQFNGEPSGRYVIEYTTDLKSGEWVSTQQIFESGAGASKMNFTDSVQAGTPQRFYRVRRVN